MSHSLQARVVDDEVIIAETLATILRMSGFSASAFNNPEAAVSSAQFDAPDLLISDVVMPQFSGVELAIRIKGLHPACKVLLFSGQAQTANLLRIARDQGHDFHLLAKPVHPKELLRQIGKQDARWISEDPVSGSRIK
jgi:DNA-binding NtrC family response regulator